MFAQDALGAVTKTVDHLLRAALIIETHHHETPAFLVHGGTVAPEGAPADHAAFVEPEVRTAEHPDLVDLAALNALHDVEFLDDARVIGQHIIAMRVAVGGLVVLD